MSLVWAAFAWRLGRKLHGWGSQEEAEVEWVDAEDPLFLL